MMLAILKKIYTSIKYYHMFGKHSKIRFHGKSIIDFWIHLSCDCWLTH